MISLGTMLEEKLNANNSRNTLFNGNLSGIQEWSGQYKRFVLCAPHSVHNSGLIRDSNPGPLAPKARIIPLDQRSTKTLVNASISKIGQMLTGSTSVKDKMHANNSRNGLFNKNTWRIQDLPGQSIHTSLRTVQRTEGSSGIWTRDLSHPKRESYP